MAVAVSDTAAMAIAAAIKEQNVQQLAIYETFVTYLDLNFGKAATAIPGSPAAVARMQAQSLNDMTVLLSEIIDQQKKLTASVQVLQSALASVSANVAAGVTTQQLAVADQIKNNQFQQQTTNAALERAELPKTVVLPTDLQTSIQSAVQDTLTVKAQVKTSALVEEQITSAVAWTTTTANNIIANSFIGTAATSAWGTLKGWLGISDPPIKETVAEQKATTRGALLVDPTPIPPGP
jgi:hypothetical protein